MNTKEHVINIIRDALVDAYAYGSEVKLPNIANHIYNSLEKSGLIMGYPTGELTTAVDEIVKSSKLEIEEAVAQEMLERAYNWLIKNERSPSTDNNRHKAAEDLLATIFGDKK